MFLLDTNIVSELRKRDRANPGLIRFVRDLARQQQAQHINLAYISVITVGELRRGVELIRHRGDTPQADALESWLQNLLLDYGTHILEFGSEEAQVWGHLRVPHPENALDKMLAATALVYDLTLVTRNERDFAGTGVKLVNPFT